MNNDNFLLEESDLEQVKNTCKYIENDSIRERAVANCFSAEVVSKYFVDTEVDTESGIHNVPKVLEDIEISDIYLKGNYIDVRLYFNENELCVPKTHFDVGIEPIAYMFLNIDENLSNCNVSGFIPSENIDQSVEHNGYYKVNLQDLVSFYDIEQLLVTNYEDDYPESFEKDVFDYLDGKLTNKNEFYKTLLKSRSAREYLIAASRTKNVFNFVSINESNSTEPSFETDIKTDSDSLNLVSETIDEQDSLTLDLEAPTDIALSNNEFDLTEVDANDELSLVNENTTDMTEQTDSSLEFTTSDFEEFTQDNIDSNRESDLIDAEEEDFSIQVSDNNDVTDTLGDDNAFEYETDILDTTDTNEQEFDSKNNTSDDIDSVIDELTEFNYTTDISPSIDTIEADMPEHNDAKNDDNELKESDLDDISASDDDIDSNEGNTQDSYMDFSPAQQTKQKKTSPILSIIAILVLLGGAGYYGYTKYQTSMPNNINNNVTQVPSEAQDTDIDDEGTQNGDAMPVETVENTQKVQATNEGNAVSIPAIEQNLDASILVSNLSVNWEVPQSYTNNSSAKRYLVRIGKVMQLNMKAELLLLSKPPITNKIAVELQYNKNSQKFEIKDFITSSGEKSVDDVIKAVVQNALNMNLGSNMQIFDNLQGNPVLIIKL